MDCVSPPALDDYHLLKSLNGDESAETASHLERCSYCRGRANRLARLQNGLTSRLYRLNCPSSIELGEFHLRMLPANQALILAQHVRECPHCTRELAQLENFIGDLSPAAEEGFPGWTKVIVAQLVGKESGFALALRGESAAPITFEADGIIIVLDVQPASGETVNILGQVAADDQTQWTGALIELGQSDRQIVEASLDDLGAFDFKGIPQGFTQITFISPNGIIIKSPIINITI